MNIRNELAQLAGKIQYVYPKLDPKKNPLDKQEGMQRSIIADIQTGFAEIYAIIMREISDQDLNLEYSVGITKYQDRLNSIMNIISIVALTIKTKLNLNNSQKVFDASFIKKLDAVAFECYKIKLMLSGEADPDAKNRYSKGVVSVLAYTDYKTGFQKRYLPGFIEGQIQGISICTTEQLSHYQTMITNVREQLDHGLVVPNIKDRILFTYSSNPNHTILPYEIRQPKSLVQLSLNLIIKNREKLFLNMTKLPLDIVQKFPELDTDYKRKFINLTKKVISNISFQPGDKEKKYLALILEALKKDDTYKSVRLAIKEIDAFNKKAFLSTAKQNLEPIRNEVVRLMNSYLVEKKDYVKKMVMKL